MLMMTANMDRVMALLAFSSLFCTGAAGAGAATGAPGTAAGAVTAAGAPGAAAGAVAAAGAPGAAGAFAGSAALAKEPRERANVKATNKFFIFLVLLI
jgi:hypothetical protein